MTKSKRRVVFTNPEQKLTTNCRFFPARNYKLTDVPVMCSETEKLYSDKCLSCGFNPVVKAERLKKMYGEKKASAAVEYSESISTGTNPEYARKWRNYKPKKGEPEDV